MSVAWPRDHCVRVSRSCLVATRRCVTDFSIWDKGIEEEVEEEPPLEAFVLEGAMVSKKKGNKLGEETGEREAKRRRGQNSREVRLNRPGGDNQVVA